MSSKEDLELRIKNHIKKGELLAKVSGTIGSLILFALLFSL